MPRARSSLVVLVALGFALAPPAPARGAGSPRPAAKPAQATGMGPATKAASVVAKDPAAKPAHPAAAGPNAPARVAVTWPAPYSGLVPLPRRVETSAARLDLGAPWTIVIRTRSAEDSTTATLLAKEAAQRGWSWRIRPRSTARVVEIVASEAGTPGDEAYRLEITPRLITIAAPTSRGRFLAVQTLRQLLRTSRDRIVPAARIDDAPALAIRAVSLDLGAAPMPRTLALAETIRELAYYKVNTVLLELDDTFELPSASLVRRAERLTAADVRALCEVARRSHVELVPVVTTLGRRARLLSVPDYGALAERPRRFTIGDRLRAWWSRVVPQGETPVRPGSPGTLCPTDPRAAALAAAMVGDVARAFPSRRIGVGGDATGEVGSGRSADAVRTRGRSAVVGEWFARLARAEHGAGRRLLVDAEAVDAANPTAWPRDLDLIVRDDDTTSTFARADSLRSAGFYSLVLAASLRDGRAFHPDFANAFASIAAATRAARRVGATGILVVSGSGGAESLPENDWAGFAWAAACAWEGAPSAPESFLARFAAAHCGAEAAGLGRVEELLGWQGFGGLERNAVAFHRDAVVKPRGASWLDRMRRLRSEMQEVARLLDECADHLGANREHVAALRHSMRRYRYLADREIVLDDVGRSLGERGAATAMRAANDAQLAAEIGGLSEQLRGLAAEYETLWLKQSRPGGLGANLQRLAREKSDLDALRQRAHEGKLEVWRPGTTGGTGS